MWPDEKNIYSTIPGYFKWIFYILVDIFLFKWNSVYGIHGYIDMLSYYGLHSCTQSYTSKMNRLLNNHSFVMKSFDKSVVFTYVRRLTISRSSRWHVVRNMHAHTRMCVVCHRRRLADIRIRHIHVNNIETKEKCGKRDGNETKRENSSM